jgi:hypothetical protein
VIKQPSFPPRRKLSDAIEAFIARNEAKQKTPASGVDEKELTINYHLLQVWDLLSLYICTQERLKEECIEPVPTGYAGGEGVSMRLRPISPTRISMEPFPFDQRPFEASLIYRRLPKSQFADAAAFEAAYFNASPQIGTFTFEPAAGSH